MNQLLYYYNIYMTLKCKHTFDDKIVSKRFHIISPICWCIQKKQKNIKHSRLRDGHPKHS